MSNPTPAEGWEILTDAVHQATHRPSHRDFELVCANLSPEQRQLLFLASRTRGIALQPYVRRATLAFVAFDIGLNWDEITEDEPTTNAFGEFRMQGTARYGAGYGPWQIMELA